MSINLKEIRNNLESKGLSPETRENIRSSKICIIDDKIADLKSMTASLRREGFNNIIEFKKVPSIIELLDANYDIIVLDLGGVAEELSKDDGYGVLQNLKNSEPFLPILVVTGSTAPPDKVKILSQADLVRSKPILAAELSSDVELILRHKKSAFWASLEVLTELSKLDSEIQKKLPFFDKIFLHFHKKSIAKKILNEEKDVIAKLIKVADITSKLGKVALKIKKISLGLGG